MKSRLIELLLIVSAGFLAGCGSNPQRTHRGNLLDDKVTQDRVTAAFKRAGPEFNRVSVTITNGEAILSGTVSAPKLRERAEEITRGTHRVQEVQDQLQVGR
ncbi:MAG TPA: BON domain-containing protein [Verrucomicrobiae bacterium]|nr:BON domain-containing protein [Verrucomicrobiae bacterium]